MLYHFISMGFLREIAPVLHQCLSLIPIWLQQAYSMVNMFLLPQKVSVRIPLYNMLLGSEVIRAVGQRFQKSRSHLFLLIFFHIHFDTSKWTSGVFVPPRLQCDWLCYFTLPVLPWDTSIWVEVCCIWVTVKMVSLWVVSLWLLKKSILLSSWEELNHFYFLKK